MEPAHEQTWRPLGQLLVERGLITDDDLDEALLEQQRLGCRLGQVLVERGHISTDRLALVLLEQAGVDVSIQEGFGSGLREELERRRSVRVVEPRPSAALGDEPTAPASADAEPEPEPEPVATVAGPALASEPQPVATVPGAVPELEPAPPAPLRALRPAPPSRLRLRRRKPAERLEELITQFATCADALERSLAELHELMARVRGHAADEAPPVSRAGGAATSGTG